MRKTTILLLLCVIFFLMLSDVLSQQLSWTFGNDINVDLRGELRYTVGWRMEDMNEALASDVTSGNTNFESGEFTNNKVSTRIELESFRSNLTLFASGEVFHDQVYTDEDRFNDEARDYAQTSAEILDFYLEGAFNRITFRLGKQIVQWGESIAPVYAVGVNTVSPYNLHKSLTPGYSSRDYQIPSLMAWISYTPIDTWAIEAVYNPDFDPRYIYPVAGTFSSPIDVVGFGALDNYMGIPIIDDRPEDFEDKQQYGLAIRKTFPTLNNIELGLYYYHHIQRLPMILTLNNFEAAITNPELVNLTLSYPEQDMYGLSFSGVFPWLDLGVQVSGELAFRPNAPMQLHYVLNDIEASLASLLTNEIARPGEFLFIPAGGYQETNVMYWGVSFLKMLNYNMPIFGWVMNTMPIIEFYGRVNQEYGENNFSESERTAYMMVMLDFTTYDLLENWRTGLSFTYQDTLHKEENTMYSLSSGINLKYGDNLSLLFSYSLLKGDSDQASMFSIIDRDKLTAQVTWNF